MNKISPEQAKELGRAAKRMTQTTEALAVQESVGWGGFEALEREAKKARREFQKVLNNITDWEDQNE